MKQNMKKFVLLILNNNELHIFIRYLKSQRRYCDCLFVIKTKNNLKTINNNYVFNYLIS